MVHELTELTVAAVLRAHLGCPDPRQVPPERRCAPILARVCSISSFRAGTVSWHQLIIPNSEFGSITVHVYFYKAAHYRQLYINIRICNSL